MIERRIREALDALTGGEVPDDLGSDGVAGRFRRRQRRNRVGGVVASAVFVGAAVVGVSQFTGSDAVAVTTAGTERESLDESGADSAQVPPETTEAPIEAGDGTVEVSAAERSDGPFEWSRSAGADPTLDVIIGLQLDDPGVEVSRYAATDQVLGTVGLTQDAQPLASIVLQLVQIDGSRDVQPFELTIAALIDADGIVRYQLSATDSPPAGCTTSGLIEKRGVLFALDIEPSAPACEGSAHRLFDGEFALEVNIDEEVIVTGTSGEVAVFETPPVPTLAPTSGGGSIGLVIAGENEVVLYDPLSGQSSAVLDLGNMFIPPALSPDRTRIAYVEVLDESIRLVVSEVGSGDRLAEFEMQVPVALPTWSPDGATLAFNVIQVIGDSSASSEVWVVEIESSTPQRISESDRPITVDGPPNWSPDGSRLLFYDQRSPTAGLVIDDLSGNRRNIEVGMSVLFPSWSPDGRRIAFFGAPEQQEPGDLWTVSPDGTSLTRQTNIGFTDMLPSWSPDGIHIAFFGTTTDDGRRLYVVGSEGEVLTVLADSPAEAFAPSWSPDGTAIAYTGEDGEVIIVDINTGARRSTGQFGQVGDWR